MAKYKKAVNAFEDLIQGLLRAQSFYGELKDSVESLEQNVDSFVNNRRGEGSQLLNQIEQNKANSTGSQASAERDRLQQLMEKMSIDQRQSSSPPVATRPTASSNHSHQNSQSPAPTPPAPPPQLNIPQSRSPNPQPYPQPGLNGYPYSATVGSQPFTQGAAQPVSEGYNPMAYPYQTPISPAPPSAHPYYTPMSATPGVQHNGAFYGSPPPAPGTQQPQLHRTSTPHQQLNFTSPTSQTPQPHMYAMAGGYMPPPPPPGPPGGGSQTVYPPSSGPFPAGPGGYAQFGRAGQYASHGQSSPPQGQPGGHQPSTSQDPWAGLSAWK